MPTADFSGRDVDKALTRQNFYIVDRTGSHVKLRYDHPQNPEDVGVVSAPRHDRLRIGTLQAQQSRVTDFDAWCDWIDELLRHSSHYRFEQIGTLPSREP